MNKPRGLGKGLGALIPDYDDTENQGPQLEVAIETVTPNPYQPRKEFSAEKLNDLAESIKIHGVIQPLLVRDYQGEYQLIAGERRLRASKLAGLTTVPVVVREMTDQAMMEVALVENIQREDLNPIEEAEAYRRLMNEFQLTQEDIAKKVGKSRPAVANALRLLNLPPELQTDLANGNLTTGHARALLSLKTADEQRRFGSQVKAGDLSVRETEELVRKQNEAPLVPRETKKVINKYPAVKDPNLLDIEDELQQVLGTKVAIKPSGTGGKFEIEYYSGEDFERIYERLIQH